MTKRYLKKIIDFVQVNYTFLYIKSYWFLIYSICSILNIYLQPNQKTNKTSSNNLEF